MIFIYQQKVLVHTALDDYIINHVQFHVPCAHAVKIKCSNE